MTDDPAWPGEKRKIDGQFVKDYVPDIFNAYYMMAGPPGMVRDLTEILLDLGIKFRNIRTENFEGY